MYKVTMQHPNRLKKVLGIFTELKDARLFVRARLDWDEKLEAITTLYEILENNKAIESSEWDKDQAKQAQQQKGFHPTPMPTVLRPPGSPPYIPDDDDDD